MNRSTKPKLLVLELWALGDLVMVTPFLRAATDKFDVTLLAKPMAVDLQPRLWPNVSIIPFAFHWTIFHSKFAKYALYNWEWRALFKVLRQLHAERFDTAISVRLDPRDHFLLWLIRAKERLGFPLWHSDIFLTRPLPVPPGDMLRHDYWRQLGQALGFNVPAGAVPKTNLGTKVVIHSGASQKVRVWPLERFALVAQRLRQEGFVVRILCDKDQESWWQTHGEKIEAPSNVQQLMSGLAEGAAFIGNDSGPGHLSGAMGIPTFTIFGDQIPARFAPLSPEGEIVEGRNCPYKPCSDQCRFPQPNCLYDVTFEEVWPRILAFVRKHVRQ